MVTNNTQISAATNTFLHDTNISLQAKGLLSYMLSFERGTKFSIENLTKCSSCGSTATRSALNELRGHGYVSMSKKTNVNGQFAGWEYNVYERPIMQ